MCKNIVKYKQLIFERQCAISAESALPKLSGALSSFFGLISYTSHNFGELFVPKPPVRAANLFIISANMNLHILHKFHKNPCILDQSVV